MFSCPRDLSKADLIPFRRTERNIGNPFVSQLGRLPDHGVHPFSASGIGEFKGRVFLGFSQVIGNVKGLGCGTLGGICDVDCDATPSPKRGVTE